MSSKTGCDTETMPESDDRKVVEKRSKLNKIKSRAHQCSSDCISSEAESQNFYDQNPFYVPIRVGYQRGMATIDEKSQVVYTGPCNRRLHSMGEVSIYLKETESKLDIDLFTFTDRFSLFVTSPPLKPDYYIVDIANGQERQPISCVNVIDPTHLDSFVYKAHRFAHPDLHFRLDPEFLSCCDCTDNCQNAELCSCQQLTLEACDAIKMNKYQVFVYNYKRLNGFLMTGVYECNQKCGCDERCANRVVQSGIKCQLQVFRTLKRGWGVRVLHDVPKGTFLCTYSAQILNEDVAQKQGESKYFAGLDIIDVCEREKDGYESEAELNDEDFKMSDLSDTTSSSSTNQSDPSFTTSTRRYDTRAKPQKKYKSSERYPIRREYFGENFCYSLDAEKTGNVGRYLNHSCDPNCFVQSVFIDTHDLRFPWVALFARKDIRAYEELTWDYNYELNSTDGKQMECFCRSHNCRKRLL